MFSGYSGDALIEMLNLIVGNDSIEAYCDNPEHDIISLAQCSGDIIVSPNLAQFDQ